MFKAFAIHFTKAFLLSNYIDDYGKISIEKNGESIEK